MILEILAQGKACSQDVLCFEDDRQGNISMVLFCFITKDAE
jgi:hypothetical protein